MSAKARSATMPVVITANRLRDGRVVWLGAGTAWVEALAQARAVTGDDAAAALVLGQQAEKAMQVVGVYAAEVTLSAAGPQPVSQKERIRAAGPSTEAAAQLAA